NPFQRGHWLDRLPAIDADIKAMEKGDAVARKQDVSHLIAAVLNPPPRPRFKPEHTSVASFRPGEPLTVEMMSAAASAHVCYRHVNQAEAWRSDEMQADGGKFRFTIPADYIASP